MYIDLPELGQFGPRPHEKNLNEKKITNMLLYNSGIEETPELRNLRGLTKKLLGEEFLFNYIIYSTFHYNIKNTNSFIF